MVALNQLLIGQYRILREVGSGGLGRVFKARDEKSGKIVAIKLLHEKFQSNSRRLGFFHRELLIAARLKHKNIVEVLDANFRPPECFIVSEFVDGWSLYFLLKNVKRMPPLVALSICFDLLQGLDYVHLHDMIHSDLSSPNIMIDCTGRVLITDFGLACQDEIEDYKNYLVGTPGYYSPEHVSETPILVQSDLYCVGLILYEMLTGLKAVPSGGKRTEILQGMNQIDLGPVVSTDRRLQSHLRKLLKKTLQFSPKKRVSSAESMLVAIHAILKRYGIRYSRLAIQKFLADQKLVVQPPDDKNQDIYQGNTSVLR